MTWPHHHPLSLLYIVGLHSVWWHWFCYLQCKDSVLACCPTVYYIAPSICISGLRDHMAGCSCDESLFSLISILMDKYCYISLRGSSNQLHHFLFLSLSLSLHTQSQVPRANFLRQVQTDCLLLRSWNIIKSQWRAKLLFRSLLISEQCLAKGNNEMAWWEERLLCAALILVPKIAVQWKSLKWPC